MLGWLLFGASAYAAFLWGHWFAISNAVINFWSLGIIHNHADDPAIRSGYERLVVVLNAVTSLVGLGLLLTKLGSA